MSNTVVIVEDSPTQAKAIATYLKQLDLQIIVTEDGPPGINAAIKYHPSVIILDVNLPSMNGFQIARRLKRHPETLDIPIIMLTSLDDTVDMIAGLDNGADYFITKGPNAADELWKTLAAFGVITIPKH